jgi:hypothetical protein
VSDARLSTLRRAALTGDLSARVAWLSEWLRTDPACEECSGSGHHLVARRVAYGGAPHHMDYVWHPDGPCSACHGTGTQRRWRVELAAYVGDEAAIAVAGEQFGHMGERAVVAHWAPVLSDWARGLSRWGRETATRAAVAASRAALDHAQRRDHRDWDWADVLDRARVCVEAGEAWLSCPCDEHLEAWRRAWAVFPPPPQWAPAPDVEGWTLSTAGRQAPCALVDVTAPAAAQASSESSVRSAIQRSLTEWALSPPGP